MRSWHLAVVEANRAEGVSSEITVIGGRVQFRITRRYGRDRTRYLIRCLIANVKQSWTTPVPVTASCVPGVQHGSPGGGKEPARASHSRLPKLAKPRPRRKYQS